MVHNKAIELDPNDAEAYYYRGSNLLGLKRLNDSIIDFTKAIELACCGQELSETNYADAYYNRGKAKDYLKDHNGAIADFTKSLDLTPNDGKNGTKSLAETYACRGHAKAKLKDFNGAISDFNKVIELNPNDAEVYYLRAINRLLVNDKKGACEDAKKSASLGYDASKLIEVVCN